MQICTRFSVSADGYAVTPDGWPPLTRDPQFVSGRSHGFPEFQAHCEAVLMGRTTFEPALTNDRWPWPNLDVFVLGRDVPTDGAPGQVIADPDPHVLLDKVRTANKGRDVHLVGGLQTIETFRALGAIDRLGLLVLPFFLGEGRLATPRSASTRASCSRTPSRFQRAPSNWCTGRRDRRRRAPDSSVESAEGGNRTHTPRRNISVESAEGGNRTHTPRREPDFESGASASSATSARAMVELRASGSDYRGGHARLQIGRERGYSPAVLAEIRTGWRRKREKRFSLLAFVGAAAVVAAVPAIREARGARRKVNALPSSSCGPSSTRAPASPTSSSRRPAAAGRNPQADRADLACDDLGAAAEGARPALEIGYQSCDDSTAQAGRWDSAKCATNAALYARDTSVMAVVGRSTPAARR